MNNRIRKTVLGIMAAAVTVALSACGKTDAGRDMGAGAAQITEAAVGGEETEEEKTPVLDAAPGRDWERYNGSWSLDGAGYDAVLANGGALLSCSMTQQGDFTGSLFTQQAGTERFAEVVIDAKAEGDLLVSDFADDGWGGSGTLYLRFGDERITAWVEDYVMASENTCGYGICGEYELIRCSENAPTASDADDTDHAAQTAYRGAQELYALPEDELLSLLDERNPYYQASAYYNEVTDYWENGREVRDIANRIEPLFDTDVRYYTEADFADTPVLIIHLAKNEIYARHGYIFQDADLSNYFMGCIWYQPAVEGSVFDDAVLNAYERQNLHLLAALDTYDTEKQERQGENNDSDS